MTAQIDDIFDLSGYFTTESGPSYDAVLAQLKGMSFDEHKGRYKDIVIDVGNGPELMTVGRVLASMIFLRPYQRAGYLPPADRFIRSTLNSSLIEGHISKTIEDLYDHLDPDALNMSISDVLNEAGDAGSMTTSKVGTSVSICALFDAAKQDPKIMELLNHDMSDSDFTTMEKLADDAGSELIERLKNLPGEYGRLLRCGSAINKDQLRQAFVNIGIKPGLMDGELMEEPINTSFLRGMRGVEDFYICAIGARKALATNYKQVKTSGYLSRKMVLLTAGHFIDQDLEDCGTGHGLKFTIQSQDHVNRLRGRYFMDTDSNNWFIPSQDDLAECIGEDVVMRSPVTCAGKTGVCHVCYGSLARSNQNIHAGIYAVLIISEQITQRLLSSKHLLKARPVQIQWPEGFLEHFSIERTSIIAESSVDRMYVKLDDLEEDDEEEGMRTTTRFYYKLAGRNTRIEITTTVPLYLEEAVWSDVESEDGEIIVSPSVDSAVFSIPVTNTDLSEALSRIFSLIERDEHTSLHETYSRLIELLTASNLWSPSIHAEMIIRAMVRDATDNMKRPDFSMWPEEPSYAVLKLKNAILQSPSITNSLAFERVKAQLTSPDTLRKFEKSAIDSLFAI